MSSMATASLQSSLTARTTASVCRPIQSINPRRDKACQQNDTKRHRTSTPQFFFRYGANYTI
jgi:hypothetical protein